MGWLKQLLDYVRHALTITQTLEDNKQQIKDLSLQVERLTEVVREMAYQTRYELNNEKHEREKILLKLENEILKFERRLPPVKTKDEE